MNKKMLCDGPDRWPDSTGYAKSSLKMEPGSTGSRISEFGTVYGNFVLLPLPPLIGRKIVSLFLPVYSIVRGLFSSGSVREVFGEASGVSEAFPKKSRRNPGYNPAEIQPQILSGIPVTLLQNPRKRRITVYGTEL